MKFQWTIIMTDAAHDHSWLIASKSFNKCWIIILICVLNGQHQWKVPVIQENGWNNLTSFAWQPGFSRLPSEQRVSQVVGSCFFTSGRNVECELCWEDAAAGRRRGPFARGSLCWKLLFAPPGSKHRVKGETHTHATATFTHTHTRFWTITGIG